MEYLETNQILLIVFSQAKIPLNKGITLQILVQKAIDSWFQNP
jgi:hypothetical protein